MTPSPVIQRLRDAKIVPVIRAKTDEDAYKLVDYLHAGGINIFEITLTVPGAIDVIAQLSKNYEITIGAGTVTTPAEAFKCIMAGAKFIVGPNTDPNIMLACKNHGIPYCPGALTPTEVLNASRLGAELVKVFPADSLGGPAYIKSLKAPFPNIDLMPTGGVTLENIQSFFDAGASVVGIGSNLANLTLLEENPEELTALAQAFLAAVTEPQAPGDTEPGATGWSEADSSAPETP